MAVNRNFAEHLDDDLSRRFVAPQPIPPGEWVEEHLTLDGLGVSNDMNIDGTTPKNFQHIVPAGKRFIFSRAVFTAVDLNIIYTDWFGFGSALTNGCLMQAVDSDDVLITVFEEAIKTTLDFAHLAAQDLPIIQLNRGTIPDVMVIRWSLFKTGYVPIFEAGDKIEMTIRDNLAGMDNFQAIVQGREF